MFLNVDVKGKGDYPAILSLLITFTLPFHCLPHGLVTPLYVVYLTPTPLTLKLVHLAMYPRFQVTIAWSRSNLYKPLISIKVLANWSMKCYITQFVAKG